MEDSVMTFRKLFWTLELCFAIFACSGCCGGCHSGYVSENTPQGRELKAILDDNRNIVPEAPRGLPIKFDPIKIDVQHEDKDNFYRPVIIWGRTDEPTGGSATERDGQRRQALQKILLEKFHEKRNDLEGGDINEFSLYLQFKDKSGKLLDTETMSLNSQAFSQES